MGRPTRARCARRARRARWATSGSPTSGPSRGSATRPRIYKVRSGPGTTYRTIAMLRFYTEDNAPENYLVLRSKLGRERRPWLQIRIPRRPNGSKGWVPRRALRMRVLTTSLEIDKRALKARLFKDGNEIWTSSIGIGGAGHPDAERPLLDPRAAAATSAATPPTARSRSAPPPTRACRSGRAAA